MEKTDFTRKKLAQMLVKLTPEERDIYADMTVKNALQDGVTLINLWIQEFSPDRGTDDILRHLFIHMIIRVGFSADVYALENQKIGKKTYMGKEIVQIAVVELKKIIEDMEDSLAKAD